MKNFILLLVVLTISGCGTVNVPASYPLSILTKQLDAIVLNTELTAETETEDKRITGYYEKPHIKNVNHYAKWITQDLLSNFDVPNNRAVFVVTDFALLDSDLRETNHFGRQLTEAIMHEVNRTGYSVIDMKSSGTIHMTNKGDLFFQTEKINELSYDIAATNIISGTMTRHRGGYLLNVRVVDTHTNSLVSTAQSFVPHEVVDAVLLEKKTIERQTLSVESHIAITAANIDE